MVDQSHINVTKMAYKPLVKEENLPDDIQFDHKEVSRCHIINFYWLSYDIIFSLTL